MTPVVLGFPFTITLFYMDETSLILSVTGSGKQPGVQPVPAQYWREAGKANDTKKPTVPPRIIMALHRAYFCKLEALNYYSVMI